MPLSPGHHRAVCASMAREKSVLQRGNSNFFYLPFQMKESFKLSTQPPRSSSGSTSLLTYSSAPEEELEYEEDSFDEELRLRKQSRIINFNSK